MGVFLTVDPRLTELPLTRRSLFLEENTLDVSGWTRPSGKGRAKKRKLPASPPAAPRPSRLRKEPARLVVDYSEDEFPGLRAVLARSKAEVGRPNEVAPAPTQIPLGPIPRGYNGGTRSVTNRRPFVPRNPRLMAAAARKHAPRSPSPMNITDAFSKFLHSCCVHQAHDCCLCKLLLALGTIAVA